MDEQLCVCVRERDRECVRVCMCRRVVCVRVCEEIVVKAHSRLCVCMRVYMYVCVLVFQRAVTKHPHTQFFSVCLLQMCVCVFRQSVQ